MYPDNSNELPPVASQGPNLPPKLSGDLHMQKMPDAPPMYNSPEHGGGVAAHALPMPVSAPTPNPYVMAPAAHVASAPAPAIGPMPAIADDTDLIEQAWVQKAKQVVAMTRQDPYQQNQQLQHVRADYMKKRVGKDIKVNAG